MARYEPIGADYFRQFVVIEPIAVNVLPQHESHHIVLTVQSDLICKDVRQELWCFSDAVNMNPTFNDLRNEGNGTGQCFVKSMRKRVFNPLGRHLYLPAGIGIDNGHTP